jgi:hypothetical protein
MKPQFVFVSPELTQFIVDVGYATREKKSAPLKEYYWSMGLQEFKSSYGSSMFRNPTYFGN